ncbi:MAG: hypothetical protein HDR20_06090 [Lachnospiraceae bacterium]|nr:hypothetical protein [Lachnospiraceae bacterium]
MKIKNVIAMGAAVVLVAGSALNVSAAEKLSSADLNALKESGKISLIIDVDAYKAAYGDLKEAFGDNEDAYIEHYLTVGVYEGRTKGVLFDPIVYAEAYGDVKQAFGSDISAIVNHYVTFGAAENRTIGTSNGYADIATAEKKGAAISRRDIVNSYINNGVGSSYADIIAEYIGSAADGSESSNAIYSSLANLANDSSAAISSPVAGNIPAASNSAAGSSSTATNQSYHHTTSIYEDANTLLRVEYYDENNKLTHYSDVEYTDKENNSYKENIYHWDEEKGEEVLDRTDTYVNGTLSSSENHG